MSRIPNPRDPHGPHANGGPLPSRTSQSWAMGAHLAAFVGAWVFLSFVGPLAVWLLRRDDPFVEHHAREALNFNLTLLALEVVGLVVGIIFVIATVGIGLLAVVPVVLLVGAVWAILTIVAAVKAANGERYEYPLTIRFVS